MTLSNFCNKFVEDALVKAINWAAEKPQEPAWLNGPTRETYIKGFVRQPGMGSYALIKYEAGSTEPLKQLVQILHMFESFGWTETTEGIKNLTGAYKEGYRYFQGMQLVSTQQYKLLQSVCSLYQYPPEKLHEVRVVQGPHGLELQAPGEPEETHVLTAIIGQDDMLVTWFPGFVPEPVNLGNAVVKLFEVSNAAK